MMDKATEQATRYMDECRRKYQQENPCPKCGSHNTHIEPIAIYGPKSAWIEYCDDCGWSKKTDCEGK
jgi:predicted nucleic-acid-binding Zn-ribbon protein